MAAYEFENISHARAVEKTLFINPAFSTFFLKYKIGAAFKADNF